MNIFYLDENLETCARYHVDRHVVKMITEYAQLLSGAVRMSGIDAGYKLTHKNHPCAIWVRESLSNWIWLRDLSRVLNDEYKFRYQKNTNHKAYDVIENLPLPKIVDLGITTRPRVMPDNLITESTIESYRKYYMTHKQHIANWKNRCTPEWFV